MSFETPLQPYNAADPHATYLNASCLELLLIELVPTAYRTTQDIAARSDLADKPLTEEEVKEGAYSRLETQGYRVGQGLVER